MGINHTKKLGFTIIELIVVLGVLGVAFPALFGILYAILQQQSRIYKISEVKRQGDFILTTIEATIKNHGYKVYSGDTNTEVCSDVTVTPISNIYFYDTEGNSFKYYSVTSAGITTVASDSARPAVNTPQTFPLTNNKISFSGFSMSCTRSSTFSTPLITIAFTVESYPKSLTQPRENVSLQYQTKIKLRSF